MPTPIQRERGNESASTASTNENEGPKGTSTYRIRMEQLKEKLRIKPISTERPLKHDANSSPSSAPKSPP